MRISDWSSDVCSSDLRNGRGSVCRLGLARTVPAVDRAACDLAVDSPPACGKPGLSANEGGRDDIQGAAQGSVRQLAQPADDPDRAAGCRSGRSEEHTSELQSLMRISYAVFCLKKKNNVH